MFLLLGETGAAECIEWRGYARIAPMNIILFTPEELPVAGPRVVLGRRDERNTHLRKVLRKGPGDSFEAGVIGGLRGHGRIAAIDAEGTISLELFLNDPAPRKAPLVMAVGFPRPIQLRRLLRDLCSMGVSGIDLLHSDLGDKSYRDTKLLEDGGAQAALVEGLVQARDTVLPTLAKWGSLAAWLDEQSADTTVFACDNAPGAVPFHRALAERNPARIAVLIGSERGWSAAERALLDTRGVVRASMGERALRTECAAIAAAGLALAQLGFFG